MTNKNTRSNFLEKATELAALPYTVVVEAENIGGEIWYVAHHPELSGCLAQGRTVAQAIEELAEPRLNLIEHLLEHNLDVPLPRFMAEKVAA